MKLSREDGTEDGGIIDPIELIDIVRGLLSFIPNKFDSETPSEF